jgi:hypothetical protein
MQVVAPAVQSLQVVAPAVQSLQVVAPGRDDQSVADLIVWGEREYCRNVRIFVFCVVCH